MHTYQMVHLPPPLSSARGSSASCSSSCCLSSSATSATFAAPASRFAGAVPARTCPSAALSASLSLCASVALYARCPVARDGPRSPRAYVPSSFASVPSGSKLCCSSCSCAAAGAAHCLARRLLPLLPRPRRPFRAPSAPPASCCVAAWWHLARRGYAFQDPRPKRAADQRAMKVVASRTETSTLLAASAPFSLNGAATERRTRAASSYLC